MTHILKLDIGGIPQRWISSRDAFEYIASDTVVWSLGEVVDIFHGGTNRHGLRTIVEIPSIIAVNGTSGIDLSTYTPTVTREKIFLRDRCICAYCAKRFDIRDLEAEHIMPKSRGGAWSWTNLVAACTICNQIKKKNMTPEEAGMPLTYLPYVPTHWEDMILRGRNVLADQMEFLIASVPEKSRLRLTQ